MGETKQSGPLEDCHGVVAGGAMAVEAPSAWASRAFDRDLSDGTGTPRGAWGPWRITDYQPPRQPDEWFQVVPLPAGAEGRS